MGTTYKFTSDCEKVQFGVYAGNYTNEPGWKPLLSGKGTREFVKTIELNGFTAPPIFVNAALNALDTISPVRCTIYAANINMNSFELHIQTWSDSVVHGVQINWMAIGH